MPLCRQRVARGEIDLRVACDINAADEGACTVGSICFRDLRKIGVTEPQVALDLVVRPFRLMFSAPSARNSEEP
jgi:hypothetical protein